MWFYLRWCQVIVAFCNRETGPEHLHTYELKNISGISYGLRSKSTLIAVGNRNPEKKSNLEHYEQIFTIVFSDSSKCRKFQTLLFKNAVLQLQKNSNVDRTPSKGSNVDNETRTADEEATPFSDTLELNFSESVLVHLDLSAPDSMLASKSPKFCELVNIDMFTHFHCSLRNGNSSWSTFNR